MSARKRTLTMLIRAATVAIPLFYSAIAVLNEGESGGWGVRNGGEEGIRTLETVARLHAFQACAFDHSATSPFVMCHSGLDPESRIYVNCTYSRS